MNSPRMATCFRKSDRTRPSKRKEYNWRQVFLNAFIDAMKFELASVNLNNLVAEFAGEIKPALVHLTAASKLFQQPKGMSKSVI